MENFYTELYMQIILISGIRVPYCRETMIKSNSAALFYNLYVFFMDLLVFLCLITVGWGTFMPRQSMIDRCVCGLALSATIMSALKSLYCILYPEHFLTIFKLWDGYFDDDPYFDDLVDKVTKHKLCIRTITLFVFIFVTPSAALWGLLPYLPVTQRLNGGKRFTVLSAWYPFDITVSPYFELAVLYESLCAVAVTSRNVAFDSIFYNLLSRQTAQIQHLQTSFKNIFSVVNINRIGNLEIQDYNSDKSNSYDGEKDDKNNYDALYKRLRIWIKHHQHTIKIGVELNKLYSPIFALLLMYEVGTTCLSGFTLIASDIDYLQFVTLSSYSFGNLLVLFVVCWLGDLLTDQEKRLLEKGFGANWYVCSRNVNSALKIIYQRCQRPFRLLGLGVYPVSSQTFLSIVMSAYSYIMVLKQLKLKGHI